MQRSTHTSETVYRANAILALLTGQIDIAFPFDLYGLVQSWYDEGNKRGGRIGIPGRFFDDFGKQYYVSDGGLIRFIRFSLVRIPDGV